MLKILEFIFQDFWHWSGMVVLITSSVMSLGVLGLTVTGKENK